MIRLVIYLLGLLIITSAIFLGATAFTEVPFALAAAVALLVLGLGVLGATYVVPERVGEARAYRTEYEEREVPRGYPPPPARGRTEVTEERRRVY